MKFDFFDKLTDAQKKWLQWLGIVLVIGVLGFFGISYPQIPVPPVPSGEIGAQAVTGAIRCGANGSYGQCFRAENGGDIAVFSDSGATSKFSVDGATGNVVAAGTLTLGGYAQSGATRFGSASTVISGTTIAHGFATTPTVFLVMPAIVQATTYTQTIYAHSCGTVSCTVGISNGDVVTFTTVHWIGGK